MSLIPDVRHSLIPLFWQRGEDHAVLAEEMCRMKSVGINDFILESRPHPDWLGEGWWNVRGRCGTHRKDNCPSDKTHIEKDRRVKA